MTQEPRPEPVPARRRTDRSWLVLGLAALVAVGGMTFALGRATAPASAASRPGNGAFPGGVPGVSFDPSASFAPGAGGPGGVGGGSVTVSGTVTVVSGSTMTIETGGGRTIDVDVSGTTWHQQAAATAADATTGTSVQVTVSGGLGGGVPGADASVSPGASTVTASDVTILAP